MRHRCCECQRPVTVAAAAMSCRGCLKAQCDKCRSGHSCVALQDLLKIAVQNAATKMIENKIISAKIERI